MAHEIEGNNAFFTSTPAWHKLGTVLRDAPSVEQAWKLAYPHELYKLPVNAIVQDSDGNTHYLPMEKSMAVIRDDGKEIGHVGPKYELVQPYQAFQFFEPWIEAGEVELEAGGSLREGTRMWALAKLTGSDAEIVKGDQVHAYCLVSTSFDGSLAHSITFTGTRVVCANTLAWALADVEKENVKDRQKVQRKFRHTSSVHEKIEAVREQADLARGQFSETVNGYRELARRKLNTETAVRYAIELFDPENADSTEKIKPRTLAKVNRVLELMEEQRGLDLVPAARGTMWQAYNAVTEYITHEAGRTDDTRVNNQWFGTTAKLNQKALDLALSDAYM